MKTIITFIIVFGVLVLVHEFGHFFFAKRSGILVREFSIGMGPKLFAHQSKKDGTTYTIRLLPIGGYVRMAGMGEDETELPAGMPVSVVLNESNEVVQINTSKKVQVAHAIPMELVANDLEKDLFVRGYINGDEETEVTYSVNHEATVIEADGTEVRIAPLDVQFQSAKLWQRMLTNFAGPLNNFLLALLLFIIYVFMIGGVPYTNTNLVGEIQANSPAEKATLKENDKILSINGTDVKDWEDFTKIIQDSPQKALDFVVERDGSSKTLQITPEKIESNGKEVGKIGISQPKKTGLTDKLVGGFQMTYENVKQIIVTLKSLFTGFSLNKLGGPVMMYQLSAEASKSGVKTIILLMASLSINLGIMNLLPIPALDGGKIVLNVLEGVRGKPLSQEKEGIITLVGVGAIMLLMVLVTWNDIQRFFF